MAELLLAVNEWNLVGNLVLEQNGTVSQACNLNMPQPLPLFMTGEGFYTQNGGNPTPSW
jgi:hypothetical protein